MTSKSTVRIACNFYSNVSDRGHKELNRQNLQAYVIWAI